MRSGGAEAGGGESGGPPEVTWLEEVGVNARTALAVTGIVAVAVVGGLFGGLFLADDPFSVGEPTSGATPTPTSVPTSTPSPSPTPTPAPTSTGTPAPVVSPVAVEDRIYQRVNFHRGGRGHEPLPRNGPLRAVARNHSEGMARVGDVDREGLQGRSLSDRLGEAGVGCEASVATVGQEAFGVPVQAIDGSTATYETAEEVANAIVRRWMNEAGPRTDVLRSEWTQVGVGVDVVETDDGAFVYATMILCAG